MVQEGHNQDFTLGAQKLSAEGARMEALRGWGFGRACPPPKPTRGSGERRELPERDPGVRPIKLLVRYIGLECTG